MRFTTKEDIEAPIDAVFREVSDFDHFEKIAIRRGAEAVRMDSKSEAGVGMCWQIKTDYRGKTRLIRSELVSYDPPNGLTVKSLVGGLEGSLVIDLVALSKQRTRLSVDLDLKPGTIPARLLVQSLRLAKTKLVKRFKTRVADYAEGVEKRYRAAG